MYCLVIDEWGCGGEWMELEGVFWCGGVVVGWGVEVLWDGKGWCGRGGGREGGGVFYDVVFIVGYEFKEFYFDGVVLGYGVGYVVVF